MKTAAFLRNPFHPLYIGAYPLTCVTFVATPVTLASSPPLRYTSTHMRVCLIRSTFTLFSLSMLTAALALPACAQDSAPAPAAHAPTPTGSTKADSMTPAELADVASRGIEASSMITRKYTYVETEHNQNFIDGQLEVDHTTVTENIFIHGLPYMRKTAVDGKPLAGKDLKRENALYEDAVKKRTALDEATRADMERHAFRSSSRTDLGKLSQNFQLANLGHEDIDGHDCIILDATPKPESTDTSLARHIRMDMDANSLDVLDIRIEFLADDNGFSKGSILDTRYTVLDGVPLASHQTWDTTVHFKELLNKAIRIHRDITYTNYRRFHATVTIQAYVEAPADPPPSATPKTPAELKADKKAREEADKKAKEEARAKAKADKQAKEEADKKAKAIAKLETKTSN